MAKFVEKLQLELDYWNDVLCEDAKEAEKKRASQSGMEDLILALKNGFDISNQIDWETPSTIEETEALFFSPLYQEELRLLREKMGIELTSLMSYAIAVRANKDFITDYCPSLSRRIAFRASTSHIINLAWDIADICFDIQEDPYEKWEKYKEGKRGKELFSKAELQTFFDEEIINQIYEKLDEE